MAGLFLADGHRRGAQCRLRQHRHVELIRRRGEVLDTVCEDQKIVDLRVACIDALVLVADDEVDCGRDVERVDLFVRTLERFAAGLLHQFAQGLGVCLVVGAEPAEGRRCRRREDSEAGHGCVCIDCAELERRGGA